MPLAIGKMTVNVSLCGSIPRSDMRCSSSPGQSEKARGAQPLREKLSDLTSSKLNQGRFLAASNGCEAVDRSMTFLSPVVSSDRSLSLTLSHSQDSQDSIATMPLISNTNRPMPPLVEPPRWAVPAKGEARLEPVCEALGTHSTVDLSSRSCFRIGRSPASDVQLMHGTSSRRHALLFHHPNGSCYIVDCGSAHGTFVNGVRVRSTPSAGMVVPHRVRRGALIRFGGPGAPSFVLKSFSVGFSYMVKDLEAAESASSSCNPTPTVTNAVNGILRKRSFDESDDESRASKRRRCVSPLSHESPIRLVSPDPPIRRVTFNEVPQSFYPSLVSPDLSADDASLE